MRTSIQQAGAVGLVLDRNDIDLPPNAWTAGINVRFEHGVVKSGFGWDAFTLTTSADEIMRAHFLRTGSGELFVYVADTDADGIADAVLYTNDATTETDITGTTSPNLFDTTAATASDYIQMCELHGHVVITNGLNPPVYWDGAAGTVTELIWDGSNTWRDYDGAGTSETARIFRPYRQFLIAMDIVDDGTRYPRLVHWSSLASPGELPPSWNYSDPAEESGRVELADTTGFIVDGLQLRDSFVIYKEDAIHTMNFIGGQFVMQFYPISRDKGMMSDNCVVEAANKHLVLGQRDIYWFDGQQAVSAAEGTVRDHVFGRLDEDRKHQCFVAHNIADNEVWVCYPTAGSTRCEEAAVLNYVENTWSIRAVPSLNGSFIGPTLTNPVDDWDDESSLDWDSETSLDWSGLSYTAVASTLYGAGSTLFQMDYTNQENGANQAKYVQRTEINLGELDDWHMVKRLYPRAEGQPFTVYVGRQDAQEGPVTWEYSSTFTPGTDYKLDCRVTGRLHALKIESTGNVAWEFSGIDIEYEPAGRR